MDIDATIHDLKKMVSDFRDERDWRKYDTPKNLAVSICIEAAELLEHFQWKNDEEINRMIREEEKKNEVSDELADVVIYCLGLSDILEIDIAEALKQKLEKNRRKYPALKTEVSPRKSTLEDTGEQQVLRRPKRLLQV